MIYTYDGLYTIVLHVLLGVASAWLACCIFVIAALVIMAVWIVSSDEQKN